MSALNASHYESIKFKKSGRPSNNDEFEVKSTAMVIQFYESLYSPYVTGSITQIDVGGEVIDPNTNLTGTLRDALPIEGNEEISMKIETKYGTIETSSENPFICQGSTATIDSLQRQTNNFSFISKYGMTGSKNTSPMAYPESKLSEVVKKILSSGGTGGETVTGSSGMGISDDFIDIDDTENKDVVESQYSAHIDVIQDLCPKSKPIDGDPGYFFYETLRSLIDTPMPSYKPGFHYRSIDSLIRQGKEDFANPDYSKTHTYYYQSGLNANPQDDFNDFKVLSPPVSIQAGSALDFAREGATKCRVITYETASQRYRDEVYDLETKVCLGPDAKREFLEEHGSTVKVYQYTLNPGVESSVNGRTQILNNLALIEPYAHLRYVMIHRNMIKIQVPCNVTLQVGQVIDLKIENVTTDDKVQQEWNFNRSGKYMILHLSHYFDTSRSYTSIVLARDTNGMYGGG